MAAGAVGAVLGAVILDFLEELAPIPLCYGLGVWVGGSAARIARRAEDERSRWKDIGGDIGGAVGIVVVIAQAIAG